MARPPKINPKITRLVSHLNRNHGNLIYQAQRQEYPWLFVRKPTEEITRIIFDTKNEIESPRMYSNIQYQYMILQRIDYLLQIQGLRPPPEADDPLNQSAVSNIQTKKTGGLAAQKMRVKPANSVAFSDELSVIKHAHSRPMRKSSRNPTSITKNSKSRDKSRSSMIITNTDKIILEKKQTIGALSRISEASSLNFDPDFLLSTVYGYQEVIIRTPDGLFSIFEPVKRRSYRNEHEFAQNL